MVIDTLLRVTNGNVLSITTKGKRSVARLVISLVTRPFLLARLESTL